MCDYQTKDNVFSIVIWEENALFGEFIGVKFVMFIHMVVVV